MSQRSLSDIIGIEACDPEVLSFFWRGGEAVNTAVCKTAMRRFESGSRLQKKQEASGTLQYLFGGASPFRASRLMSKEQQPLQQQPKEKKDIGKTIRNLG